jgi:hypothetical protein
MVCELTQEVLKQLLHYNPDTGVFTWLDRSCVAGCAHRTGYIHITIRGKLYSAHQLAFLYVLGYIPKEIDHKDRIRHNNIWSNLRECTRLQNGQNQSIHSCNTSGTAGVIWYKNTNKWMAFINANNKRIHLGYFKDKDDAISARRDAEEKYWHGV